MISPRISQPRFYQPKLRNIQYSARKSLNLRNSNENIYSNEEQQMTFALEKLDLVNEIKQIKKDIEVSSNTLRKKEKIFDKKLDRTLKDPYNRTYNNEEKKEVEQFQQNASKVQVLQSNVEELDTQIRFFKSFFSEDSLTKIQDEVQAQKRILSDLLSDIQGITEDNELLLCDIEGQCLADKIQQTIDLKALEKKHKEEIKKLKKECKELMKEATEIQKNDPLDKNKKEIILLKNKLMKLQRRRSIRERDQYENNKRNEVQKEISKDVREDIKQDKIRDKKEKEKINRIKETSDFNSHNLMPIESYNKSSINEKHKYGEEEYEEDTTLFEITQQQNNYKEKEEVKSDEEQSINYQNENYYTNETFADK